MIKKRMTHKNHIPKRAHHYKSASSLPQNATAPMMRARRKRQKQKIITMACAGAALLLVIIIVISVLVGRNKNENEQSPNDSGSVITDNDDDRENEKDFNNNNFKKAQQKYYYDKLSNEGKKIYEIIEKKVENMPESISLPANSDTKEIEKAFFGLMNDHPEMTMINGSSYSCISGLGTFDLKINYQMNMAQYQDQKSAIEERAKEIISKIPNGASDFEKELIIHDEIIENCVYSGANGKNAHNAYGALVQGKAVCEGYAEAMKIVLNKVGIDCITVSGQGTNEYASEAHEWNMVKIDSEWYILDVTWDDPAGKEQMLSHDYFNLTTAETRRSHRPEDEVPECTATAENYFVKTKSLFDSYDSSVKKDIAKICAEQSGKSQIDIKFTDSSSYKKAFRKISGGDIFDIIDKANSMHPKRKIKDSNVRYSKNDEMNIITFIFEYK